MAKFVIIRRWETPELMEEVNKYLKNGWHLHGDTFVHMEFRNHAVTGEEYMAPIFCQSMVLEGNS